MRTFRLIDETPLRPGCGEIQVEGEVDLSVAHELEQAIERTASEHDRVLIGLQSCEFIDSTTIAVIVQAHRRMAERGKSVAVYGGPIQIQRILSITGLTQNGLVFESRDDALSEMD